MPKKNNMLQDEQRTKLIELLNRRLADAIDLQLQSRQAYWNVKGPNFMSQRELFNKITQEVEQYANVIAEHIVQLGGVAEGTTQAVAGRSSLDGYRLASVDGTNQINALSATLIDFKRHVRYSSEQANELKDADTADIFITIGRGIDKWLWFVETSQQPAS